MRILFSLLSLYLLARSASAERYPFSIGQSAEVVAELRMSSPGSDWSEAGREAALASVTLDGKTTQHLMLYAGADSFPYRAFLGAVSPGDHELVIERDDKYSARGSQLSVEKVSFESFAAGDPYYDVLAHAPVLFARQNTVGKFSDIPLVVYCEKLPDGALQYTVIFSNEDGGTSTRALMARWGRTTDIEFAYRVQAGEGGAETIQASGHNEVEFKGEHWGSHPQLIPSTDNNMFADQGTSPIRYQVAPIVAQVRDHSRETVMDEAPITYMLAAKELKREDKLRPFGVSAGEKVSDPRNYLMIEYRVKNAAGSLGVRVRRKTEDLEYSSMIGRADLGISRDGWVRAAVELRPGTKAEDLATISFDCVVAVPEEKNEPMPHSGTCTIEGIGKLFLLDKNYRPGPNLWKALWRQHELRSGQSLLLTSW
jgi:hypothetical protein